ncbi:MAG: crotonase/enoyl-CoA hydratase family protein [Acidimicrobiia bacterium]
MSIVRERHDHVEVVRIDRPEAKNAVNDEVALGLEAALDSIEADDDVRVVVITGTGDTFSAGADLKMIAAGRSNDFRTKRGGFAGFVQRDFPKPIIAAVNGTALAGGFEIVLACDLVVSADTANFGLFEVKRGLIAAAGGLIRLPRKIPQNLAMEIAIAGTTIDAKRLHELGLVNRIVPAREVVETAVALGAQIAENAPLAVRRSRSLIREALDLDQAAAWKRSKELQREVFAHPDATEGSTAFAEKRAPIWTST